MSGIIALVAAALIVVADQLSKAAVASAFTTDMSPIPLLGGLFNIHYTTNGGAAWSILDGKTWLLVAISLTIVVICIYMLAKKTYGSKLMFWAVSVVLAGGVGNLIDRIFRGGRVIDFIEFGFIDFPIFNIADIAVCVGAGLIVLYFITDTVREARSNKAAATVPASEEGAEEQQSEADAGK